VTTTADDLLPAVRPSLYDRWAYRVRANPARLRMYCWLAPTLVTMLAAVLRFWHLGDPHAIIFDETYYVKDAWSQWNLGYAANWPPNADASFVAGHPNGYLTSGSFVVHPPLGKWIIGAGMWLFGPASSFGWRFSVALFGTATVLLVYLVAKRLSHSIVFATIASFLVAIDGLSIVLSRVSLLDGILTFFILLAFWFVLLDRQWHLRRLDSALGVNAEHAAPPSWGPVLWGRPWLVAAGAAAGCATAVKWSGLYVIAGLGIYIVVTDALARRRAGVRFWPMDAVRQALASFVLLVPVAFAVYLASWTGWLVTNGGYDRHVADASPARGFWSWVPLPLQSLWRYHEEMYAFNVGLSTPHSYASPAWQWPLLIRPTSMYWAQHAFGRSGCTSASSCVEAISSIPNPLTWWAGVVAVLFLAYAFVVRRDWRHAFVLTGVAATYVPWLLYPDRTIFQFYTVVMAPFLALALTFALRALAGRADADARRRLAGQRTVLVFLTVVLLISALWYPVWTAIDVPYDFWRLHNWMQTWI
jgi:dolichyl-phosphate-mannose-protein mannosyltransferase